MALEAIAVEAVAAEEVDSVMEEDAVEEVWVPENPEKAIGLVMGK